MDRGSFPADGHAGEEADREKQTFTDKNAPGKNMAAGRPVLDLQGGDSLRNAGSIGALKETVAQLANENHAEEEHRRLNPGRDRLQPLRK